MPTKRHETKIEAEARAYVEATRALARYYRRPDVSKEDTGHLLAILALRWTTQTVTAKVTLG